MYLVPAEDRIVTVMFCIPREKSLWDIAIEQSVQKEGKYASVINRRQNHNSQVDNIISVM